MDAETRTLIITSSAFENGGEMPKRFTGFGEDISPDLRLSGLSSEAVSLAVTMDDLDIPMMPSFNHWLIWNIPAVCTIPSGIPHGKTVSMLDGARQGVGFGTNSYRGPKQPFFIRSRHRYLFTVYALNVKLNLSSSSRKADLIKAMQGHVLQQGSIVGTYKP